MIIEKKKQRSTCGSEVFKYTTYIVYKESFDVKRFFVLFCFCSPSKNEMKTHDSLSKKSYYVRPLRDLEIEFSGLPTRVHSRHPPHSDEFVTDPICKVQTTMDTGWHNKAQTKGN